jgi:hypothetical protein
MPWAQKETPTVHPEGYSTETWVFSHRGKEYGYVTVGCMGVADKCCGHVQLRPVVYVKTDPRVFKGKRITSVLSEKGTFCALFDSFTTQIMNVQLMCPEARPVTQKMVDDAIRKFFFQGCSYEYGPPNMDVFDIFDVCI